MTLGRRAAVEALGTAFLLAGIVGSGIMGVRLAGGNEALALLANSLATAGVLYAAIVACAPHSGAHFNPAVTLMLAGQGQLPWGEVPAYVLAQCAGAVAGVWTAHAMFGLPLLQHSLHVRAGLPLLLSEGVATLGLLLLVLSATRSRSPAAPQAIAAYIAGAYWFTASTAFANPAVTLARSLTGSFAGIRPADAPGFIAAQLAAAAAVMGLFRTRS
ncbi:MAG TPA: aquaporin [Solimonas sp.]|nr:aquaporin [Solimonas sp.]